MKNIYTYILFIIIGTFNYRIGTHAQKKSNQKENVALTEEYLEKEARSDAGKLFSKIMSSRGFNDNNDNNSNETAQRDIKILLNKIKLWKKSISGDKARRNIIDGYVPNAEDQKRFYKVMHQLASSHGNPTIKKLRMKKDEKFLEDSLRKTLTNITPDIHLVESTGIRGNQNEPSLRAGSGNNLHHSYNKNEFVNFVKSSKTGNTFQNYDPTRTKSYLPLSANLEKFNELLNRFNKNDHNKRVKNKPRKNKSGNDGHIAFIRNNSPMSEADKENLDAMNYGSDENHRKNTMVTVLRTDINDDIMYADINEKIDKFENHFNDDKSERNIQRTVTHGQINDAQLDDEKQTRRFFRTQAGYTQDPDTCKTYNENLEKLWSNLSKYLNVTEQPDELALHNIAMMVQAYLEHHSQQSPEPQTKHEGSKDKVTEIILRIRKTLEDSTASGAKIVKIIKKYAKPFYGDVETEDCQLVNEEYLQASVDLLFKKYEDNQECYDDNRDSIAMNKRLILRNINNKSLKPSKDGLLPISNTDFFKPDKSIYLEGELFKDFHRGKVPRNRRVSQQSRKPKHVSPIRSRIENEKVKTRKSLKDKPSHTRSKKSRGKSDGTKSKCEKIAIRKLTSGLRPVIERFTLLLECQMDNTLRSEHYLYASKYYSGDNEENYSHKKKLPISKLSRKNTSQTEERQKSSRELEKDGFVRDDGYTWIRKQSDSVKLSDIEDRASDTTNDYIITNNDFQPPLPVYDDYDGLFNTPQLVHPNPMVLNPLISINDKKTITNKVNSKTSHTKNKGEIGVLVRHRKLVTTPKPEQNSKEDYNEIDPDYGEGNVNLINDNAEELFQDLTRLRHTDELLQQNKNTHTYESLSELVKRARDVSLQTPEVVMPFALDSNKGYVELTYLVKYPKMLVYRPQFLVKNVLPYDAFVKTLSSFNMTNNDIRVIKIVRHLPNKSVKVLFETEDYEEPLQVRNVNENWNNRRTENDILQSNKRLSPTILYNIGSIINKVRYNDMQHELSRTNMNEVLFSSDTETRTIFTTSEPNPLHDTSSLGFKSITNTAELDDNLGLDAIKSPFSDIDSESSSSQDASDYGDSLFLPILPNVNKNSHTLLPPSSTSVPNYYSASSLVTQLWNKLKKIIKDKIMKKLMGNMASVTSNIDKLIS